MTGEFNQPPPWSFTEWHFGFYEGLFETVVALCKVR
jgi:hypothetical protein